MAPGSARRGKRRADDDADESDSRTRDYDSESSRRSQPRRRTNGGTANSDDSDSDVPTRASRSSMPNGSQRTPSGTQRFGQPSQANDDKFKPGSIVRVAVNDFCAYTRAEFFPGPYLNMVIGPNGTGKSTLVNAICLGLGFSPKVLNRADAVSEFVKHGRPSALVEIELKRKPKDEKNYVIRLKIRRDSNTQKFWIDNREAPHKKVLSLVREYFNIQVDNLCQFLPQDQVAAFAAMGEVQLLDEMLRAAAPEKVIAWHQRLKERYKDLAELQKYSREHGERLEAHQNKKRDMQPDVDRVKEREEAQRQVELTRATLTATMYTEAVASLRAAKAEKARASARVKELEQANEPSLRAVKEREAYRDKVAVVVQRRKMALADTERAADRLRASARNADDEVQRRDASIHAQMESYKKKKAAVAEVRRKINQLEAQQRGEPPAFDSAEWNMKIVSSSPCHESPPYHLSSTYDSLAFPRAHRERPQDAG